MERWWWDRKVGAQGNTIQYFLTHHGPGYLLAAIRTIRTFLLLLSNKVSALTWERSHVNILKTERANGT